MKILVIGNHRIKIDNRDYALVRKYKWGIINRGYARTFINGRPVLMHRLITNCPDNLVIDHLNHDQLDNRRCNLRICTLKQNQGNRLPNKNNKSGHRGISKFRNKWRVFCGKHYLGVFEDLEQAVEAQTEYATKYFA